MIIHVLRSQHVPYTRITNTPEIALECPKCVDAAHSDNKKLFFNIFKKQGHCKRCGLKVYTERELLALLNIHDLHNGEIMPIVEAPQKIKHIIPPPRESIPAHTSREARAYLTSRGLSIADMKKFGMLYCEEGFYGQRIIAPICDRKGNYRTWVSRSILPSVSKKYLYPKGTATSRLLYNLHFVRQTNKVVIVEGIFDAIHFFPYAVASFGKQIYDAQISLLRLHGITTVHLMFDAEAYQETPELWEKAVKKLSQHFFTFPVKLERDTPTEHGVEELKRLCGVRINGK